MTTKTTVKTKTSTKVAVVYTGPTIPKTGLYQNTILTNGVPAQAQQHITQCPAISKLIVPIEDLPITRKNIGIQGTVENKFFNDILDYLGGVI